MFPGKPRSFTKLHNKMKIDKLLLSTLAGGVAYFILGFLMYGMLFMKFFEAHSTSSAMKDPMDWWALILGNLIWALFLAYVFSRWASVSTFMGGLKAGAVIGLLVTLAFDLTIFGTSDMMDLTGTLVDPIVNTVMTGITGGVVGWVLGMGASK